MSFDKNLIAKNFSLGAKTYDEAAQIQLETARDLVDLIRPYLLKNSRILDLGSGTSFIAKQISNHDVTEVDIAADMLKSWADRPSNVKTICADFEKLNFAKESFDLILSSFSLQWSEDFAKNFQQYFSFLSPGGIFAFALPVYGSLSELKNFNLNEMPQNSLLKLALKDSGFREKFFVEKEAIQLFKNSRDLLKFLKRIGANSPKKRELPLNRRPSKNVGTRLSWRISYFVFEK
jgi:malonyl-CoA O-methyltransferase